jgi:hypothetical protein
MSSKRLSAGALWLLLGAALPLAADSLHLDYSGSSAGLQGSTEYSHALGGSEQPELNFGYTRSRSYGSPADAYSSLLDAGADGPIWQALQGSVDLGYETQDLYNIHDWQPSIGLRWRWKGEPDEDGDRPTYLKLNAGLAMAFYNMDTRVPAPGGGLGPGGRPRTVDKKLTLNKAAPKLKLSLPLFTQDLWAWTSYTAYGYDKDPVDFTDAVESVQPHNSRLAARLDSLNSQLKRRAWSFGSTLDLPWESSLSASFGRSQYVVDDSTSSEVDVTLDLGLGEHLSVSGGWTRSWDGSGIVDQGSAGVELEF